MLKDKGKILSEKIEYLITMELTQRNFEVLSVDTDIVTYTPDTTGSEPPEKLIEGYIIFLHVDYNGRLDGDEPYSFGRDIQKVCESIRDAVTQYTITKEGKIVAGDKNIECSDAFIFSMEYKLEESHKFGVNFSFTYPE
jgi:hypothetical protein